jgi:hypothetical protein
MNADDSAAGIAQSLPLGFQAPGQAPTESHLMIGSLLIL